MYPITVRRSGERVIVTGIAASAKREAERRVATERLTALGVGRARLGTARGVFARALERE